MPLTGGSMDPRDIVGRDGTVEEMRSLLARGGDIVINDPRRMGKTCLLDRFAYLTRPPLATVKIDYEGVKTSDEFLRRTIDGLRAHEDIRSRVIKSVKSFMDNVEVGAGPLKVNVAFQNRSPSELLNEALVRVDARLKGEERLVLALDEVSLAVENIARNETPLSASTLLHALRQLRQNTQHIRWIVTGSAGSITSYAWPERPKVPSTISTTSPADRSTKPGPKSSRPCSCRESRSASIARRRRPSSRLQGGFPSCCTTSPMC